MIIQKGDCVIKMDAFKAALFDELKTLSPADYLPTMVAFNIAVEILKKYEVQ